MSLERELVIAALPAYAVLDELGRGGWGIVLEGEHRQLGRRVAIKQLPRAFSADPEVRSRFVAEARLLASLDHPHIVPVFDFVERDGMCLLVMEKLSRGSVWLRFTRQGMPPRTTCAVGLAAAAALHHAHQRRILHRDVKPENLMFSAADTLKVTDFGIAKVLGGGRTMATRAGDVVGTPAYMAPEQALGEELGPATDLYALGVTLYELLSGALPFPDTDSSPMALLYRHVHEDPPHLADVVPVALRPVAEVVMRSLRKDPRDRHEDAEAFGAELAGAATLAFGTGWLAASGLTVMAGGRILAAAERDAPVPMGAARPTVVSPVGESRGDRPGVLAPAAPADLVPIAELPDAPRSLDELGAALGRMATPEAMRMAGEVERLQSGAHDIRELQLLQQHRSGRSPFPRRDWPEAERLLGAYGTDAAERVGLAAGAPAAEIRAEASLVLARWQRCAESPLSSRELSRAARVLVRTCEGILERLDL